MPTKTREYFQSFGAGHLPGHLGVEILAASAQGVESRLAVTRQVMAPNGYLHAASVIALADTSCGYGCVAALPKGASGFTTIELKANFLGTAREGATILCRATPVHLGRTTHVWDALVRAEAGGAPIARFRCTQMILWPK
jgi:1,4-dihydroxy-2-naphthoyl-CoA hydrolase